jgi:DNA polymerase elongation subunit (family B)
MTGIADLDPTIEEFNFAIDIETDNSEGFGLVPERSRVTEVAIAVPTSIEADGGVVFNDDSEVKLLNRMADYIADLPSGIINDWNGAFFDLPFMADRARILGIDIGLTLLPVPGKPKYDFLPGHTTGYTGLWLGGSGGHVSYDISKAYQHLADEGVSWSLKPVAKHLGIEMIELDRENLHKYTQAERDAYNLSDATGTLALALMLYGK